MRPSSVGWLVAVALAPVVAAAGAGFLAFLSEEPAWVGIAAALLVVAAVPISAGLPAVVRAAPAWGRVVFTFAGVWNSFAAVAALAGAVAFAFVAASSSGGDGWDQLAAGIGVLFAVLLGLSALSAAPAAFGGFALARRIGRGEY